MVRSDRWAKRPVVIKYFSYANKLKEVARDEGYRVADVLDIVFYIPMPKSWSKKKKRDMYTKKHQQRPDIDNLIKAFLDPLCEDDSFVWSVHAEKYWDYDGKIVVLE